MTFLEKYLGGRKFILTIISSLITTLLVWFDKVDGTVYATVILGTVGAFIAGNVTEKLSTDRVNGDFPSRSLKLRSKREDDAEITTTTETKVKK